MNVFWCHTCIFVLYSASTNFGLPDEFNIGFHMSLVLCHPLPIIWLCWVKYVFLIWKASAKNHRVSYEKHRLEGQWLVCLLIQLHSCGLIQAITEDTIQYIFPFCLSTQKLSVVLA